MPVLPAEMARKKMIRRKMIRAQYAHNQRELVSRALHFRRRGPNLLAETTKKILKRQSHSKMRQIVTDW